MPTVPRRSVSVLVSAGIGAAIGLGIDAGNKKQFDVYQRTPAKRITSMRVPPMLSTLAGGIRMSMKF